MTRRQVSHLIHRILNDGVWDGVFTRFWNRGGAEGEERETNDKIYAQTTLISGVTYNLLTFRATQIQSTRQSAKLLREPGCGHVRV